MLAEAEGQLAQMLSDAGLKLSQFDAQRWTDRGFGQQDKQQEQNVVTETENDSHGGDTDTTDGLIVEGVTLKQGLKRKEEPKTG